MNTQLFRDQDIIEGLQMQARSLGASATGLLPTADLVVEARFANMCAGPTPCPSYGQAPGCPPHAPASDTFKRLLQDFHTVLVFKIDAPVTELMGEGRLPLARTIHRIAATLERSAVSRGIDKAKAMAAGSCKELFCGDEEVCVVLAKKSPLPASGVGPSLHFGSGGGFCRDGSSARLAFWQTFQPRQNDPGACNGSHGRSCPSGLRDITTYSQRPPAKPVA